uniref:Olfactory receptor family 5 subfamily A member 3 n=1 Tax=Nannospalax galili TaxID=1026970 RepID=A0A8C6QK91_NANGA
MAMRRNISLMTNFTLLEFLEHPQLQVILFVLFLGIYLVTLVGNLGLIVLIRVDSHLYSPVYFFLGNLSFVEVSYTSSIAPKTLCDFFREQKAISFGGCVAQLFFFIGMGAMAYDRYAAISNPLLYSSLTSPTICVGMAITPYAGGFLTGLVQTMNFLVMCAVGGTSVLVVLVSYGYIIAAVMKIHSTQGRMKAFNTCASHLSMVILFYASGLFSYLHSSSAVVPVLNPIVYNLRDKEIKDALKKLKERKKQMSQLCVIVS